MIKLAPLAPLATAGAAVLALSVLSGCGGNDTDSATDDSGAATGSTDVSIADLEGMTFEASTPDALDSSKQSLVDGSPITVGFEGSNLSASAGCNGMGGKVAVDGGTLDVKGGLVGTEMACADPVMAQERWLSDFLTSAPEIALDGDTLTLTGADGTLTLVAVEGGEAPADPDQPDDGVSSLN